MINKTIEPPARSAGDIAHTLAKAGLSAIPSLGGPAAELFQLFFQAPLERRRDRWMAQVVDMLEGLKSQGVNLDDLRNNEEFVSAVMHASQVAIRSHQADKLKALRNAILNVAKHQAPEEALQCVFLNLIDAFSELHLRILKLFQAPTPPPNITAGGLGTVLEHGLPELRGKREIYDQLWKDLYSRGLVNVEALHVTMSTTGLSQKRTTGIGDAFLRFIEEPR